jgi:hypothetical protein
VRGGFTYCRPPRRTRRCVGGVLRPPVCVRMGSVSCARPFHPRRLHSLVYGENKEQSFATLVRIKGCALCSGSLLPPLIPSAPASAQGAPPFASDASSAKAE